MTVVVVPRTRYATSGELHVAYQVFGRAEDAATPAPDLVVVHGWVSNVELVWEEPRLRRFLEQLGTFARVLHFDKRGTGLSDRVPVDRLPSLSERADDLRAVMDAADSGRAYLFGYSEGVSLAVQYAAAHPDRVSGLVLTGGFATRRPDAGYPWAPSPRQRRQWIELLERSWGGPADAATLAPSLADDPEFGQWWGRYLRASASPAAAVALATMNTAIDVRPLLSDVRAPTLVLHRTGDRDAAVEGARWIARQLPNATYEEHPGDDHLPWVGDADAIVDAVATFVTGRRAARAPRRTLATVLFTDVVDSTGLAATLGDARWRRLLDRHDRIVAHALTTHDGRQVTHTGDGVLAAFDAPAAAIRAALRIRDELRAVGVEVRAGIHTGECEVRGDTLGGIAVHIGARVAALASAGEVVVSRTVADLVQGSGTRFADHGTHALRGVPGRWQLYRVRDVTLEAAPDHDSAEARRSDVVDGTSAHTGAGTRHHTDVERPTVDPAASDPTGGPFVGRTAELDRLVALLDDAAAGRRRTVFVTGETGIGKTTLVDAFRRMVQGRRDVRIALGRCADQHGAAEPYLPLLDALGRLSRTGDDPDEVVAVLTQRAPNWLLQLSSLIPARRQAELEHARLGATAQRMVRELADAVEALAGRHPLVLVLEDLHWADDATLDALDWLTRRRDPTKLLVLGTYRPGDAGDRTPRVDAAATALVLRGHAVGLALDRFERDDVAGYLVAATGAAAPPDELVTALHTRTAGVPLFVGELLRTWTDRGLITVDERWDLRARPEELMAVPDTVRQLVEYELSQLAADDVELLGAAAVVGETFTAAGVAAALRIDDEQAEHRCATLARHSRFVRAGGRTTFPDGTVAARFAFTHHLHRTVLYDQIPPARRARLHDNVGRRLEAAYRHQPNEHVGELAHHFSRGRDAARAAGYLLRAGEQAITRNAHKAAVAHLEAALASLQRLPATDGRRRLELAIQTMLATALVATRGWAAAEIEQAYERALQLSDELDDPVERQRVRYGLATMHELRGEYAASEALMTEQLRDPGDELEIEAYELLACSTFHQGAFAVSAGHAAEGLGRYDDEVHSVHLARYGEHPGVSCSVWAALALWFLGRPDESLAHAERALRLAATHSYALTTARAMTAFLHQFRGEVAAAERMADETLELALEQGFPLRAAQARIVRGWAHALGGASEAGLTELQRGLDAYQQTGAGMDWPYHLGLHADALLRAGDASAALAVVDEALTQIGPTRTFFAEPELHRLRGRILATIDPVDGLDGARTAFRRALEVGEAQGSVAARLSAALHWHDVERRHGDEAGPLPALRAAVAGYAPSHETPDLARARAILAG